MPSRLFSITYLRAALSACVLLLAVSCKSKEEQASGVSGASAAGAAAKIAAGPAPTISGDLVARAPVNSFAILRWEGAHPAHKKLLASPWGSGGEFSDLIKQGNPGVEKMQKVFAALGLDPAKPDLWAEVMADAVFFASPGTTPENPVVFGSVFRSAKTYALKTKLAALRDTLQKEGQTVEDAQFAAAGGSGGAATGFTVKFKSEPSAQTAPDGSPVPPASGQMVLAANDEINVVASDVATAQQVLNSTGAVQPAILGTDLLGRALAGTPGSAERFAIGLFDIQKFVAEVQQLATDPQAKQALQVLPAFQAAAFSLSMTDTPQTDIRLLFDPARGGDTFFKQLSASPSASIVGGLPANPLLFLSIDGATLKRIKDAAMLNVPPEQQAAFADLAVLDTVKRVAISARIAPAGKSFLPVPDLLIAIESSSPAQTAEVLQKTIAKGMQDSGMGGGSGWTKRTVGAATIQSMPAQFGFNLSVGTTPNLVLISSSENMLETMLNPAQAGAGSFAKSLTGSSSRVLSEGTSVGNLYVNFAEVGTLLETMGGLLTQFAPQDPNSQQMLTPEKIASLKKMGIMVATVELTDNMIGIQSFYQPVS